MTDTLHLLVSAVAAWTLLVFGFALVLAASYPWLRQRLRDLPVYPRILLVQLYVLAPFISASTLLGLYANSRFFRWLVPDHCHQGMCGPHWLHMPAEQGVSNGVLIASVGALALAFALMVLQLVKSRRYLHAIHSLAAGTTLSADSYTVIDADRPLAWCAGFWRCRVYLSRGLVERLNSTQLRAVLAHELTHACRRDNFRKWVIKVCTAWWPPVLAARCRNDFGRDLEHICDLAACEHDPGLEDIACLLQSSKTDIQARLDGLVREQVLLSQRGSGRYSTRVFFAVALILWLLLLLVFTPFAHLLLEWLTR